MVADWPAAPGQMSSCGQGLARATDDELPVAAETLLHLSDFKQHAFVYSAVLEA